MPSVMTELRPFMSARVGADFGMGKSPSSAPRKEDNGKPKTLAQPSAFSCSALLAGSGWLGLSAMEGMLASKRRRWTGLRLRITKHGFVA